jgi:hypothetical protein
VSNPTIPTTDRSEAFVQIMTQRMASVARSLADYVQAEPRPLQDLEAHIVRVLHDLGNALLTALLPLAAPPQPAPDVPCPCGRLARYQRLRPATVSTLLGQVTLTRALYHCTHCGLHLAPLDTQLQLAAGGLSTGLNEVLALLGATQDSFAQASEVLERLCLVQLCSNSARAATEDLGEVLASHAQQVVATAQQTHSAPEAACAAPPRIYLSMDGVLAHIHDAGWKELKTGCVYTTRTRVPRSRPEKVELRAEQQRYVAALTDAEQFGWQLWAEACRCGLTSSSDVVVVGDGAHWIWNVAETHFPHATQILDWYHASEYVWNAATTIFGEGSEGRKQWAKQQLDALWDGQVVDVLARLECYRSKGEAVSDAISYYTTHQTRMDYPSYRARGLQIGSGTIESACKQLVSARLKLAGMIWDADGAEAVAVVRAWLKSDRWDEAMRLRPPPQRTYRRQAPAPEALAAAA